MRGILGHYSVSADNWRTVMGKQKGEKSTKGYAVLKARQRTEREGYPEALALRVHRALSWLNRAEMCEDADGRFIFLWIAFNAAYAKDIAESRQTKEKRAIDKFLKELVRVDQDKVLYGLAWSESGSIQNLLKNQYVYEPFWDFHRGNVTERDWKKWFKSSWNAAKWALTKQDTATVLSIVLERMYTLRNQLVHGGATWNSSINRDQLRGGDAFMSKLVPHIIELMMDHPEVDWGNNWYRILSNR